MDESVFGSSTPHRQKINIMDWKNAIILSLAILVILFASLAFYLLKRKYDYNEWKKAEKKREEARKRRREEFYFKVRDRI